LENPPSQPGPSVNPEELAKRLAELEAETARLRAALTADVKPESELRTPPPLVGRGQGVGNSETEVSEPEPPSEALIHEVDSLLARYRLEKSRGNREFAEKSLAEACEKGLMISSVQEVMGDELAERRKNNDAIAAYKRAIELDPKNMSAEKKHADLVFKAKAASMTFASTEFEAVASSRSSQILSMLIPGAGQLVNGEWVKGGGFLAAWIIGIVWVIITPHGLSGLSGLFRGGENFNAMVLLALIFCFIVWISSVVDAGATGKAAERRRMETLKAPVRPPVDLPFE
jgi:tetratricopeptide (TPR) repeat protein